MGTVKEKERTVCPAGVILTVLITTVNAHNYGYATFGIYCFTNLSQPLNLISNHFLGIYTKCSYHKTDRDESSTWPSIAKTLSYHSTAKSTFLS